MSDRNELDLTWDDAAQHCEEKLRALENAREGPKDLGIYIDFLEEVVTMEDRLQPSLTPIDVPFEIPYSSPSCSVSSHGQGNPVNLIHLR